jgi:hypothetical protein
MGTMGSCLGVRRAKEPHTNLWFLMLKHWFCWKYQYKKYMFNFIDHLQFIPVSVCIDKGLSALLWPGPKMLIRRTWPYVIHHVHFMNMYRLYIAWYRPILLRNVGCISWYFRNKTLFLRLKDHTFILYTPALLPSAFLTVNATRVLVLVILQCLHCP